MAPRKKDDHKLNYIFGYTIAMTILTGLSLVAVSFYMFSDVESDPGEDYIETAFSECNVPILNLTGEMVTSDEYLSYDEITGLPLGTSSEDFVYWLNQAAEEEESVALIINVDSGGGMPVAGEEIHQALQAVTKPTIAVIRSIGASSAYLAAAGSDYIFASQYSDVGGIGVTASYLNYAESNVNAGFEFINLQSAPFKDLFNPDKPVTEEERLVILEDVRKMHNIFVSDIAKSRKLPETYVAELADGNTMLGSEALNTKLIDAIGGIKQSENYLTRLLGIDIKSCHY